jgi:alpha-L-rhamnosidase
LQRWPDTDYRNWYLGDWATPESVDQTDTSSVILVNNCYITICYETMQKIASILGKTSDADEYARKKDHLRNLVHRKFFNAEKASYGSGSQIDLAYPLLARIVPDSLIRNVTETLHNVIMNEHNGHIATGLVGIPVFTEWAVKNREADLMYSMLTKKDYPGYLYMTENGATTTWEHWNGNRSRIHNCYNGIGSWFYQAPGGIRADDDMPAFKHLIIEPQIPEGITWANTSKETPCGNVAVRWKSENQVFRMEVSIPVGSIAKVIIPDNVKSYIKDGVNYIHDLPFTEIGSGNHIFEWKNEMP